MVATKFLSKGYSTDVRTFSTALDGLSETRLNSASLSEEPHRDDK